MYGFNRAAYSTRLVTERYEEYPTPEDTGFNRAAYSTRLVTEKKSGAVLLPHQTVSIGPRIRRGL